MYELSREEEINLLMELNRRRLPFRQYEFCAINGEPELGTGGSGVVFALRSRKRRHREHFAVKVIGLRGNIYRKDAERLAEEIRLQREVQAGCPYGVVEILEEKSLYVRFDENAGILDVAAEEPPENLRDYRLLLFIRMELLAPLLTWDQNRCPRVAMTGEWMDSGEEEPDFRSDGEEAVLNFALDIGEAILVAHEHRAPILHRDIKLENTFYYPETNHHMGRSGFKLGDFGLARITEGGGARTRGVGTTGNIAPEAEGRGRDGDKYDERADIYSFGIMLYLLLNDLNYQGSDRYRCNWELQYLHPESPFPEPIHGSPELRGIVLRACSYRPEDRYQSMAELLHEVGQLKEYRYPGSCMRPEVESFQTKGQEWVYLYYRGDSWWELAGNLEYWAARFYQRGEYRSALVLTRYLAGSDNPYGQRMLGVLYMYGAGVEADLEEAFSWLAKAAAQGDDMSAKLLEGLHVERSDIQEGDIRDA